LGVSVSVYEIVFSIMIVKPQCWIHGKMVIESTVPGISWCGDLGV